MSLFQQAGNDFGEEFDELRYVMAQVMIIKLRVEEPKILFDPPFREVKDIILRCFQEIIASGEGLPRVECDLFHDMRGQRLLLRSVKVEESLVAEFTDKAMAIFKDNTVGPQK
jgi:dynein heavy chain